MMCRPPVIAVRFRNARTRRYYNDSMIRARILYICIKYMYVRVHARARARARERVRAYSL